jgi:hypothetical protein
MSTFFDGLGIKLFDGLPAIPTCCRASGNGTGKTRERVSSATRESPAMLYGSKGLRRGTAVHGTTGHDLLQSFARVRFGASQSKGIGRLVVTKTPMFQRKFFQQ